MKGFLWTFAAVFAGIWLYSRFARGKLTVATIPTKGMYEGPMIDPLTGMSTVPGNGAGTVGNPSGSVDNFGPLTVKY